MVRLMKVKTNASTMFVAYEAEEECLYILDYQDSNPEAPSIIDEIEYGSCDMKFDQEEQEPEIEM